MSSSQHQQDVFTRPERKAMGKSLRREVPRSSHGDWSPAADRPDPISILEAQDASRLQHLVPIKYGRMSASPFAFLRGSAAVMAADLADTPATGVDAILCGDAHLSNFGLFASPERRLVFDMNDFDEVYPGPWEWDLKRLAASAVVAGRGNGYKEKINRRAAEAVAETYGSAMERFSRASTLDMWYYHVDAETVQAVYDAVSSKRSKKAAAKTMEKARRRTQERTLEKLTHMKDGQRRIISDPPLLVPLREETIHQMFGAAAAEVFTADAVLDIWNSYLDSLPDERRFLLQRYRMKDVALRVGGVGSVGTRCFILLLEGEGENDALILQLKESGSSVLEAHLGGRGYHQHAERVVVGQRLIQATSDIFLGWHTSTLSETHYYWRQLKDMKGSADVEAMDISGFQTYLRICSWCLARAHARTSQAATIAGYIGSNKTFAKAIGAFAVAYADQTERDYEALQEAIHSGRVVAEMGI